MIQGFVDLQVNGYKGIDFNAADLSIDQIHEVSEHLWELGVVAYCPTVATSSIENYDRNIPLFAKAYNSKKGARILGIHLEGPFISSEEGARGIHPTQHITEPSIHLYEHLRELAEDKIAILTLAPERPGAMELIKHVTHGSNTVVSMGHHLANAETIFQAVDVGAKACTHIGNGLPEMIHRHKNPIWPVLADDRLSCFVISDGHHLSRDILRIMLRSKGVDQFIVTSDMSYLAGLPVGEYEVFGLPVVLEENGRLHVKDKHGLAGSANHMLDCINIMASLGELDESGLNKIGYENPLALLGMEIGSEFLDQTLNIVFNGTHIVVNK